MGRRSRKRSSDESPTHRAAGRAQGAGARPRGGPPRRKARLDEAPPAPWAPLPLTELCILIGFVLLGVGFFGGGPRRFALMGAGVALIAIGTLEFAIREHFAGYRSHTTLLSGLVGVAVMSGLSITNVIGVAAPLAIGIAVAGLSWWGLRGAFRRRAGGLSFRA